jgi:hypothetical protein
VLKAGQYRTGAHEHPVRGLAKVGLFAAFAAANTNLRAGDRSRAQVARVHTMNRLIAGDARMHPTRPLAQLRSAASRVAQPAGARADRLPHIQS